MTIGATGVVVTPEIEIVSPSLSFAMSAPARVIDEGEVAVALRLKRAPVKVNVGARLTKVPVTRAALVPPPSTLAES